MSLELVVVAIIVLVVALVVLTIFGTGMSPFGNLASFQTNCRGAGKIACQGGGVEPITWRQPVKVGDRTTNCQTEVGLFATCCQPSGTAPNVVYNWGC